jgi:exodeoxyribonuclease V beta subunit
VADRIARMLGDPRTGFAQPGGGFVRLRPRDVAVLVVRHGEAVLVEEALRARGIATVRQTQERIFGTSEAAQLRLWMRALVVGATERELRAAAAGVLVGWSARGLDDAGRHPARWSRLVAAFAEHGERWRRLGFLAAWEAFVSGSDLRDRLLPLPDGERRFTNLAQLAEILQRAATADRLGPQALLDWFERHLADADGSPDDEHLLRLDRDDDAVRLVTIHASKGLEYPVVFCPFLWEPNSVRRKTGAPVAFHDPDDERRLHVDVSGAGEAYERAKEIADGEGVAERLRLIYVALTRARNRCHVVWGAVPRRNGGSEGSALGWLLHPPADADRPVFGHTVDGEALTGRQQFTGHAVQRSRDDIAIAVGQHQPEGDRHPDDQISDGANELPAIARHEAAADERQQRGADQGRHQHRRLETEQRAAVADEQADEPGQRQQPQYNPKTHGAPRPFPALET